MLLDGAVRFSRQAQETIAEEGFTPTAHGLLSRVCDIVEELTNGVASARTDISKQLEELYAFLYRQFVTGRINEDLPTLERSIDLLAYQRETWQCACEKLERENSSPPNQAMPQVAMEVPEGPFSLEA